jgi:hypothetical protein
VTVKYVLWNNSDSDYNDMDYAFPVDYIWANSSGGPEPEIKRIAFFRNDERLDFARSEDRLSPPGTDSVRTDAGSYMEFTDRIYRRWYHTRFNVEKHSMVQVEVQYTLSNLMLCDNGNSPYNLTFFDGCSRRSLTCDFFDIPYPFGKIRLTIEEVVPRNEVRRYMYFGDHPVGKPQELK